MSVSKPQSISRSERRKQQTREQLVQACRELLIERHYDGLTVQAITDRADLGYGTFYLHFKDKDEIVWAVMQEYSDAFNQAVDARLADIASPRRELLAWQAIFEYVGEVREGFAALFGTRGSAVLTQYYRDC